MVCQDGRPNPNILAVSGDSCRLAFVGPSKCMVTIVETASLDEVSVGPPRPGLCMSRYKVYRNRQEGQFRAYP